MCEPAKVKLEIEMTKDDMKAITADTVIFEETDGYVVMGFLQTYSPSKDEEGAYTRRAQVVSRITLSWEQFARLIPRMADYAQKTQEKAEANHKAALKIMRGISKESGQ